ncbi:MAG: hypothetical protein HY719_01770 [Planctomycetes bacterium]|nr:hypothetical protein [Planctomycetota bacterium]
MPATRPLSRLARAFCIAGGALAGAALGAGDLRAGGSSVWVDGAFADFVQGTAESVVLTSDGRVRPGRQTTRVDAGGETVWSTAISPSGTLYVGTGNEGRILRLVAKKAGEGAKAADDDSGKDTPAGAEKESGKPKESDAGEESGKEPDREKSADAEKPAAGAAGGGKGKSGRAADGSAPTQTLEVVYDSPEVVVTDLLFDAAGNLYAATIPNGRVYRIDPEGAVHDVAKLSDPNVWAIALSSDGKKLFAATGPKGALYEIALPGGAAKQVYATEEKQTNFVCLARDDENNLFFGSSADGRVYRRDPKGKVSVLAELAKPEVRAIAVRAGVVYAAANAATSGAPDTYAIRAAGPGKIAPPGEAGRPPAPPTGFSAMLARISYEGRILELLEQKDNYYTDVALSRRGVYAATGMKGLVYEVYDDQKYAVIHDSKDERVLSLLTREGSLAAFGTGEKGSLHLVGGAAKKAEFISRAFDTKFPSSWGALTVNARALERSASPAFNLQTRGGNVAKPDATWSEWADALAFPGGAAPAHGVVKSPRGRFVQYKVTFEPGGLAEVKEVSLFYRPDNQAPHLDEMKVENVSWLTRRLGRETHTPKKKVTWKATDADGDRLAARVFVRQRGRETWIDLTQKPGPILTGTTFEWDTISIPDGVYELRLEVSDELDNARPNALAHSLTTDPFVVDNNPPDVVDLKVSPAGEMTGAARDTASVITLMEHAVDQGEWRAFDSRDGVLDSREETFRVTLPVSAPGDHVVAVRVTDGDGNQTVAKAEFTTGR